MTKNNTIFLDILYEIYVNDFEILVLFIQSMCVIVCIGLSERSGSWLPRLRRLFQTLWRLLGNCIWWLGTRIRVRMCCSSLLLANNSQFYGGCNLGMVSMDCWSPISDFGCTGSVQQSYRPVDRKALYPKILSNDPISNNIIQQFYYHTQPNSSIIYFLWKFLSRWC